MNHRKEEIKYKYPEKKVEKKIEGNPVYTYVKATHLNKKKRIRYFYRNIQAKSILPILQQ